MDIIKLKKGPKANRPTILPSELTCDNDIGNERLVYGGQTGAVEFPNMKDINEIESQLIDIMTFKVKDYSIWDNSNNTYQINITKLNSDLSNSNGGVLFFNADSFTYNRDIILCPKLIIRGLGREKTSIKYTGTGKAFKIPDNLTKSQEWDYKGLIFQEFSLYGNGISEFGTDATNYGIYIGDKTRLGHYCNAPYTKIINCRIQGFNEGIYLESFSNRIINTYIGYCNIGLTHVQPLDFNADIFIEYCNEGFQINPDAKYSQGHRVIITGTIQRNHIGARIQALYDLRLQTYCELNDTDDIILGNPTDTNRGTFSCEVDINTTNDASDACISIFNSVNQKIKIACYGNSTNVPHVKVDGSSAWVEIYASSAFVKSSNPWIIGNPTIQKTRLYLDGNLKYFTTSQYLVDKAWYKSGTMLAQYSSGFINNGDAIIEQLYNTRKIIKLENGDFAQWCINDSSNNNIFYIGLNQNANLSNKEFIIHGNGRGLILDSPNGTHYKISVNNSGQLVVSQTNTQF